ncbi:MAG: hypothetical protein J5736_00030 [Bacilli bacterium]|nr:hypothetical protein [Bacilli bacterium]
MERSILEIVGEKEIRIEAKSESKTWMGGDADSEKDEYLLAYPQEDKGIAFLYQFLNDLEHSLWSYRDTGSVKCGYYRKDGTPVAACLFYDYDGHRDPKEINVFHPLEIGSEAPDLIGTYEKDGLVYSGKFKNGKLHGFGFVAERKGGTIKITTVGLFDNGALLKEAGPNEFQSLSLISDMKMNPHSFGIFQKAEQAAGKECCFDPSLIQKAFE